MGKYTNKREEILSIVTRYIKKMVLRYNISPSIVTDEGRPKKLEELRQKLKTDAEMYEFQTYLRAFDALKRVRTIIMSEEQANIFLNQQSSYADSLEYILPFTSILLQFSSPLSMKISDGQPYKLHSLILEQVRVEKTQYERVLAAQPESMRTNFMRLDFSNSSELFLNKLFMFSQEGDYFGLGETDWQSTTTSQWLQGFGKHPEEIIFRNLALSCIGYINCENIYLEKEGEVLERVNRKREREGKKILEPYYVCRIKGVKYDANGYAIGEGTHHGFRYDVRGHFRRYETGKTTWVRSHQRGLQNELYIPKTYLVEKEHKQPETAEKEQKVEEKGSN